MFCLSENTSKGLSVQVMCAQHFCLSDDKSKVFIKQLSRGVLISENSGYGQK